MDGNRAGIINQVLVVRNKLPLLKFEDYSALGIILYPELFFNSTNVIKLISKSGA